MAAAGSISLFDVVAYCRRVTEHWQPSSASPTIASFMIQRNFRSHINVSPVCC